MKWTRPWAVLWIWALAAAQVFVLSRAWAQASIPLGLPVSTTAVEHKLPPPEAVDRGRKLFFDTRLSADGRVSCATCHDPTMAFADGKSLARGVGGRTGTRNTPTLLNAALGGSQFWDGRRQTLESQVLDPFVNPNEHGLRDHEELLGRIRADATYEAQFRRAAAVEGAAMTLEGVRHALAAYVRSLASADSPVDRFLFGNDRGALTTDQVRGLDLFRGAAQCATCHRIEGRGAAFTDHAFHSLAIGMESLAPKLATLVRKVASTPRDELDRLVLTDTDVAAMGRFVVTLDPRDLGSFKTPSLRNVALTAPYMHDGSIATLEQAIDHELYYRSQALGRPLILTPREKADLAAFLRALTSPVLPR